MQNLRCGVPSKELSQRPSCVSSGPTTVHVDNKGIMNGLQRGEMRCIGPRAKDADLWILIWEALHKAHQGGILVEVEHAKAHRFKKEMQDMSPY